MTVHNIADDMVVPPNYKREETLMDESPNPKRHNSIISQNTFSTSPTKQLEASPKRKQAEVKPIRIILNPVSETTDKKNFLDDEIEVKEPPPEEKKYKQLSPHSLVERHEFILEKLAEEHDQNSKKLDQFLKNRKPINAKMTEVQSSLKDILESLHKFAEKSKCK